MRLGQLGRKYTSPVSRGNLICDVNGMHSSVRWDRKSVVLFTEKESERRIKNNTSVMSRLDGLIVGLRLVCTVVVFSSQKVSSEAELADFAGQQLQKTAVFFDCNAEHTRRFGGIEFFKVRTNSFEKQRFRLP